MSGASACEDVDLVIQTDFTAWSIMVVSHTPGGRCEAQGHHEYWPIICGATSQRDRAGMPGAAILEPTLSASRSFPPRGHYVRLYTSLSDERSKAFAVAVLPFRSSLLLAALQSARHREK